MADLARRAQVDINKLINPAPTPQRRGQHEKTISTPTAAEGAREGILTGLRFVLTGVWPFPGSRTGLALGKERIKTRIEKFGGTVTMSISRLTDALVVSNAPGPKKITEAHNQAMKIITLEQLNDLILRDITLEDLTSADYPESAYAVLDAEKI
jgi:BRCT domain type II-containing protein